MKCANCKNEDERTLWDDGDTTCCSKCCHRTSVDTDVNFLKSIEFRKPILYYKD